MTVLLRFLSELLFPQDNACLLCGRSLFGGEHLLCDPCGSRLEKQMIPANDRITLTEGAECCLSAFYHAEGAAKLVHLLKYNHVAIAAGILGSVMAEALVDAPFFSEAEALVPVPVHALRLRERGYNQAMLLAREVSRISGKPIIEGGLLRLDKGASQVGRSRKERLEQGGRQFRGEPAMVAGKKLVLVDDVLTTGATVQSCAKALHDAGALQLWALTACRA